MNKYMAAVAVSCCFVAGFSSAKTTNLVPDTSVSSISQKPWLRESLPDNALMYARIPSIWSALSYKEDSFKYAFGNAGFTQSIEKLQNASPLLIDSVDKKIQPWLDLFIAQINGPIELAVLPGAALPELILSASIKLETEADLQTLLATLKKQRIIMGEAAPMTEGAGLLQASVGNVPYRWDQENNRLSLLVRLGGGTIADLDSKLAGLTPNENSPMLANEQQLDSSQQGLYVWLNNTLAFPLYEPMLRSQNQPALQMLSIDEIKSIALSAGVRDQKGRVKLQIEAPTTGMLRSVIPTNANTFNVNTAGEPNVSVLLAIPSKEQFAVIEQSLNANSRKKDEYQSFKSEFKQTLGFEIEDIFSSIGAEFIAISDNAGEYGLIKIRDGQQFNSIMQALKKQPGVSAKSQIVAGIEINHLVVPGLTSFIKTSKAADKEQLIDKIFNHSNTHLYWQLDGEFLVLASLPQILIDRALASEKVNLGQWYKETQRQDVSGSTFALSGSVDQAPRRIYYSYLEAMQFLADVMQVEIDPFSLPSAKQLSLAQKGSLGLQIDSTQEAVSLEMSFESTPADVLLAAPVMGAFSTAGILSAVAIPAYQDYIFRASLASTQQVASVLKGQVALHYQQAGKFPDKAKRDEMLLMVTPSAEFRVDVVVDAGEVITTFSKRRGQFIKWTPVANEQQLEWQCTSNLEGALRPQGCAAASL